MNEKQKEIMKNGKGFIAALDQSGGSTPKALEAYGISAENYHNEQEMFASVHEMRKRIIQSPAFIHEKIIAVILFKETMNSKIDSMFSAEYLWNKKQIIPFLKIDEGLEDKAHGVQLMKEMKYFDTLIAQAKSHKIFGTKMRSVIWENNEIGIKFIVHQQFLVAKHIHEAGMIPIIEPEVNINANHKQEIEKNLKQELIAYLDTLEANHEVIFKLTPPEIPNFYKDLVEDERVLRVVFLSGGHPRSLANQLLRENDGVIASFSRALTQGLQVNQSVDTFDKILGKSIQEIYEASTKSLVK